MVLTLVAFAIAPGGAMRPIYDLICIVLLFPIMVVVGALAPTHPRCQSSTAGSGGFPTRSTSFTRRC